MAACAPRSCSCSFTSIVYSEIVTEYPEADCTCARVLQTTTCLPQPLPREPDYLLLEKTFVSDSKPFVPSEPQRIYYARSFPKHVGESFTCHYDQTVRLRRYQKSQAEWVIPRDPNNTPFHSVHFFKTNKQQECQTLMKEEEEAKVLSISTVSHDCFSIYKAMGSSGSNSSSGEDEADRLVSMWQKVFVMRSESEHSTVPIFDSGDETNCSLFQEQDNLTDWYRELDKMNVFLDSQPSLSTLSCSTATSIPVSAPIPAKSTFGYGAKAVGNALYNRVRQVFSGKATTKE